MSTTRRRSEGEWRTRPPRGPPGAPRPTPGNPRPTPADPRPTPGRPPAEPGLFGDEGQQKAFGIIGPAMGLGAVAGPLACGLATAAIPVLAIGGSVAIRWLPRHARSEP